MTSSRQDGLMSHAEAVDYWDSRHRGLEALRSGGNTGYDEATNEIFYLVRLGRLVEHISLGTHPAAPLDVLDAGCGKGYFARGVARCGHRVVGVDGSAHAVETARVLGGGPGYEQSTLSRWRSPHLFDVVYCIDVLFHVTEDAEWRESLLNLASLVRLGGRLILTEWDVEERAAYGHHQLVRPTREYTEVLAPRGMSHVSFSPGGYRDSGVGFHIYTRTA